MRNYLRLTSVKYGKEDGDVYINIDHIGDFYQYEQETHKGERVKVTKVGVTTHNNGGFSVSETPIQILELISINNSLRLFAKEHLKKNRVEAIPCGR